MLSRRALALCRRVPEQPHPLEADETPPVFSRIISLYADLDVSKGNTRDMKLSVVIPLLNEEPHLERTLETIRRELAMFEGDYELVLIDDGSSDGTWKLLQASVNAFGDGRAIRLSRRFGKELALCAGLERARGDAVVVMDGDLQHPPRLIPEMVRCWEEEGFDVVEGVKQHRGEESRSYRAQTGLYYVLPAVALRYRPQGCV